MAFTLGIVASGRSSSTPPPSSLTISMFSRNTSTSTAAFPLPVGTQVGDIAVFLDGGGDSFTSTPPALVVPTGFTQIFTNTVVGGFAALRATASYKILNASDISTGTISGMSPGTVRKQLRIIRPSATVSSVIVSTPVTEATGGDPVAQTISMNGLTTPVIGFAWGATTGGTATITSTPAGVMTVTNNTGLQTISDIIYNSSPINIIVDMNDPGTNIFTSWWMSFT